MRILDLDMDFFMNRVATDIDESVVARLPEEEYGDSVWSEQQVRDFLENQLGLSKEKKSRGRIVTGHNEALFAWKEWMDNGDLLVPFEVVHVDSHADLGLGYSSWTHILDDLLHYPVEERPLHSKYKGCFGKWKDIGIGDYLLYAIAFQWVDKLTYCANPNGEKNDYLWEIMKEFKEKLIWNEPVQNTIQLIYNPEMELPDYNSLEQEKHKYWEKGIKEPEVPFLIIPTIEKVKYEGDFDFVIMAQSPNYTPASADFIMNIFKEYIDEY